MGDTERRLETVQARSDLPPISVIIATIGRPDDLNRCLTSLAEVRYPCWELLVVDQGDPKITDRLLGKFQGRPLKVMHLTSPRRGLSRARNMGIATATGDLIAFLDDDCTIGPTWLEEVAWAFARHPTAGLLYGTVADGLRDPGLHVPTHRIPRERELRGLLAGATQPGIGAAMYGRRESFLKIGPFDTWRDRQGRPFAAEDFDVALRALAAGLTVATTPSVGVQHYGGRSHADGSASRLCRHAAYSQGAMHAKLIRCGLASTAFLMAARLAAGVKALRPFRALRGGGPTNAAQLLMYTRGLLVGLTVPLDRQRCVFAED